MEKFERVYNVPLRDAYLTTRVKATRRAITILREFIGRHAKVDMDNIKLSAKLNHHIWANGRKKPPRHVKIRVVKENNVARAYLHDEKTDEKKAPAAEKKEEGKTGEEKKETSKEKQESKK